jgi:hypothetical protein
VRTAHAPHHTPARTTCRAARRARLADTPMSAPTCLRHAHVLAPSAAPSLRGATRGYSVPSRCRWGCT